MAQGGISKVQLKLSQTGNHLLTKILLLLRYARGFSQSWLGILDRIFGFTNERMLLWGSPHSNWELKVIIHVSYPHKN